MNYSAIKTCDIANGTGVRTSLFVSGCTHHCKGCFQPETWDFNAGEPFDQVVMDQILKESEPDYVQGLSLLGGEPMEPDNQRDLVGFLHLFKETFPGKDIWCFTGYTYESDILADNGRARCEVTDDMLSMIDFLVDGEFIEAQKDITLKFKGSRNQRIWDIKKNEVIG